LLENICETKVNSAYSREHQLKGTPTFSSTANGARPANATLLQNLICEETQLHCHKREGDAQLLICRTTLHTHFDISGHAQQREIASG